MSKRDDKHELTPKRRKYPAAEALAGTTLRAPELPATRAFSGLPAKVKKERGLAVTPQQKLQVMVEKTVTTLLVTATEQGDLTFRADIDGRLHTDLSVDVTVEPRGVVIVFYTTHGPTRLLIEGHERELRAHLESKGLRVARFAVLREPDPNAPPAVPLKR